jgi:hypothetical protein
MHRRRSLLPAVLTRAEIPISRMSAAASSGPAVVGIGFSRTGRCGEDVAELGALDVPTVQYILHAGNPSVLDGGEDRGLVRSH